MYAIYARAHVDGNCYGPTLLSINLNKIPADIVVGLDTIVIVEYYVLATFVGERYTSTVYSSTLYTTQIDHNLTTTIVRI